LQCCGSMQTSLFLHLHYLSISSLPACHLFSSRAAVYVCVVVSCRVREYAGAKKMRFKPIIVSHHMLMGLKEGQEKMSKSDPESAIFMEDSAADVRDAAAAAAAVLCGCVFFLSDLCNY
jgi:hypothetical protein